MSPDDMLSTGEAADLLGIDPKSVRRFIDRGELTAARVVGAGPGSTHYRVRRADVQALATRREAELTDDSL